MELPSPEIGRPQEGKVRDASLNLKPPSLEGLLLLLLLLSLLTLSLGVSVSLSSFVMYPSVVVRQECVMYTVFHNVDVAVSVWCHLTSTPCPLFSRNWQVGP